MTSPARGGRGSRRRRGTPRGRPAPATGAARRPAGPRAAEPRSGDQAPAPPPTLRLLVLAALAIFTPLALLLFDPRLFTGGDNVVYWLLARALAVGRGYVTLYEPGAPVHTFYPPGYPALLVPVVWLSGGSLLAAKALSLVAAFVSLGLAARWLARRLPAVPEREAVLGAALLLTATNATFLTYSHWTLSEMPFLAISLGALLLAEREGQPPRVWLAAAVLAAVGYLVRTAALPLCVAVAWAAWRRAGWRAGLGSAAVALAAAGGWAARNAFADPAAPGYVAQLLLADPYDPGAGTLTVQSVAGRIAFNLETYLMLELPRMVWPFVPGAGIAPPAGARLLGVALTALAAIGLVRQVRSRGVRAGEVYAVLYAGVLAVWPWNGERFLLPLLPLLLAYVGLGLAAALGALARRAARLAPGPRARRAAATAALAAVALPNVAHAALLVPDQLRVTARHLRGDRLAGYEWFVRDYFTALLWIRDHTPADAVVVSRKPQFTYYWSGRPSRIYPYLGPDEIEAAVRRWDADVLVLDRLGLSAELYLLPYLRRYVGSYDVAFTVGEPPTGVLLRRR